MRIERIGGSRLDTGPEGLLTFDQPSIYDWYRMFPSHVMGTFGTNRIYSVGRMVKVADSMRWGFAPAWVPFPPYLNAKFIRF